MSLEAPTDNGPLLADSSIPQHSNEGSELDSIANTNNGQMDHESSLVIDPKGSIELSQSPLITPPPAKTEIEITNGEHGNGDAGSGDEMVIHTKMALTPEDSGIEGNGQLGASLTSEI